MDMSDLSLHERPATLPQPDAPPQAAADPDSPVEARWRDLVTQISVEIAGPLTAALERVHALAGTGRIDRQGLQALREEVEQARAAGMIGQQLARFASGRLRQSHERLALAKIVQSVLTHRARETQARGVRFEQRLKPVEVIADAALLSSLLNALLDWTLANARTVAEFRVEMKPSSPAHARLGVRFAYRQTERNDTQPRAVVPGLDSLNWRLLQQTAWTMGLLIERRDSDGEVLLSLEFPRTVNDQLKGASAMEIDQGFAPSTNSKPLAGSHVLVLGARREVRQQVREAIRGMGLIIDVVGSVNEAAEFCREGLPHAIVFEAGLRGEGFEALRESIAADAPEFVWIEIVEEAHLFEISSFSGSECARVGRDAIAGSLPSALMFELSKGL